MISLKLTRRQDISAEMLALCKSVTAKRPRTVIDHILRHGKITTEDLSGLYGYDHPPRAIRDVREWGIPLLTHWTRSTRSGRRVGTYTFGDPRDVQAGRIGGRKAFSKTFKKDLVATYGSKDNFTGEALHERYLQIDHRVPYEISGNSAADSAKDFMLLDGSSQRAKSWSCENCQNFLELKDPANCQSCYWAYPENYTHVALKQKRRVELVWTEEEVADYTALEKAAQRLSRDIQSFVKLLIREKL